MLVVNQAVLPLFVIEQECHQAQSDHDECNQCEKGPLEHKYENGSIHESSDHEQERMDQGDVMRVVFLQASESGLISRIGFYFILQSDSGLGLENKLSLFLRVDRVLVAARLRGLELGSILDISKWLHRSG